MSDKKSHDSDTIRQQKKAREDFLELKKMQSGEITPSFESHAHSPKTFKEKSDNFWFYNKFTVFGVVFLIIVLAVGIVQCNSRVDYDLSITLYTATPFGDEQTDKISKYFKKYCQDVNGDDEVNICTINCSYADGGNRELMQAKDTKLQSILVSEPEAMLFIVDDTTLSRLNAIPTKTSLFSEEPITFGDTFCKEIGIDSTTGTSGKIMIVRRNISKTTMQSNKKAAACYKEAGALLEKLGSNITS